MSSAELKINDMNWATFTGRAVTPNSYTEQLVMAWAKIYLADMQRRYSKKSRGGGEWKAISKEREKEKGNKLILVETGKLMKALQLGALGSHVKVVLSDLAVEVGFSEVAHDEKTNFRELAKWHNNGEGSNPKRVILEEPSPQAKAQMIRAAKIAFTRMQADLRGG